MRTYLINSIRFFFSLILCSFFIAVVYAGTDDDITPQAYATAEAAASTGHYAKSLCNQPGYTCRSVTINDNWFTLFPHFQDREKEMRLNRTNVALMYRNWIVVPDNLSNISYMSLSPLPAYFNTQHHQLILVDLRLFAFGAYDASGNLIYWGPINSGATQCADTDHSCKTATGDFRIYREEGADCVSNEFPIETDGGAPMPYCMFFNRGDALHASTLPGFINHSGGCVRLFYDDAKWLYEDFAKVGTRVVVTNDYRTVKLVVMHQKYLHKKKKHA